MPITEEQKKALKEFDIELKKCACGRVMGKDGKYCSNCEKLVIDFMNTYGLGILCNDIPVFELTRENAKLKLSNEGLTKQLDEKIKRVEELKKELGEYKDEN